MPRLDAWHFFAGAILGGVVAAVSLVGADLHERVADAIATPPPNDRRPQSDVVVEGANSATGTDCYIGVTYRASGSMYIVADCNLVDVAGADMWQCPSDGDVTLMLRRRRLGRDGVYTEHVGTVAGVRMLEARTGERWQFACRPQGGRAAP